MAAPSPPSPPPGWGDPTVIPRLVAEHIVGTASSYAQGQGLPPLDLNAEYLSNAISEITPETQTSGAALLQLTLIDTDWQIQRSGICNVDSDGLLYQVDIEYPPGMGVWWRLAMVEGGSDLDQPNLTLTFQQRIISYLTDCWGAMGWPAGKPGTTRAQFLKMLCDKMPQELPKSSIGPGPPPQITFICPEINEIQPVASANQYGTEVVTGASAAAQQAGINKMPALTTASKVTIQGQKPTTQQIQVINAALGVGRGLNAPTNALIAIIYAGMGESKLGADPGTIDNVWQAKNPGSYGADPNWTEMATAWFKGTGDFGNGFSPKMGGIAAAQKGLPVWQIANGVEDNGAWGGPNGAHQDSYGGQWPGGMAAGIAEATNIVNAFGGALPAGVGSESDVAELTRGTPDNPDEDSWTCMQRLASEVNWSIFSSPSPRPGFYGDYIYYMDGPTLVAQKPSVYLTLSDDGTTWAATDPDTGKTIAGESLVTSLSYTFDNTAFQYEQTRQVKGRTQHKTRIRKPQTPSQLTFDFIGVGALEFNGGDVFVVYNAGPLNGRWILEDVTHNTLQDLFAQLTLGPPTLPYPEPEANTTTVTGPNGQPVLVGTGQSSSSGSGSGVQSGALGGAAQAAQEALKRQQTLHCFHYQQRRPIQYDILTGNPVYIDCSGFTIACYKAAGLHDPSNNNYNGTGYTGDMITNAHQVSEGDAEPGDMVFYGPSTSDTRHVTVYIGNGQCISMGQEGDPSQGPYQQMGPTPPLGIYRTNFVPSGSSTGSTTAQSATGGHARLAGAPAGTSAPSDSAGLFGSLFGFTG